MGAQGCLKHSASSQALTSYPVDGGKWCREMVPEDAQGYDTEDTRSSVDLNALVGEDGLCVVRAICAVTQKTPNQLSGTVKNQLKKMVQGGLKHDENAMLILQKEGLFPGGQFQKNVYKDLKEVVQAVGQGAAKGCTDDGRYMAFFKVHETLDHCVCVVKQGSDVKIVDTYIQENLEKGGWMKPSGRDHLFTLEEYYKAFLLLKITVMPQNPWATVIGNP